MVLLRFSVQEGVKRSEMSPAHSSDFSLKERGTIEADELLRDQRYSLYCVDPESRQFCFVRTAERLLPSEHSFFYLAQYRAAEELVRVEPQVLLRLSRSVEFERAQLVFLHSTGRCGSTLLSRAFGVCPGVVSLSEPDVFTRLPHLRARDGSSDRELSELCAASVRLLWHSSVTKDSSILVLKGRSQIMELADLLGEQFPQVRTVFAYRDAVSWLGSFLRALLRDVEFTPEENRAWEEALTPTHPLIDAFHDPERPLSPAVLWTIGWVSSMEAFLRLSEQGIEALPVCYDELRRDPPFVFGLIAEWLSLPLPEKELLARILESDSQAGTPVEQSRARTARPMSQENLEECRSLVAGRPLLCTTNFRIPGTLAFD